MELMTLKYAVKLSPRAIAVTKSPRKSLLSFKRNGASNVGPFKAENTVENIGGGLSTAVLDHI
jgi:hypothetical protein